jgi:hypothetical protein
MKDAPYFRKCREMVSKMSLFMCLAQIHVGRVYDIGIVTRNSKPLHLGLALGHIADRSLLTRALLK